MVGVTDYDRVDRGSGETLSSLGSGGKVFSEVAKRLQMMWARKMIREKLRDEKHTGRNHMLFDFDRAGITIAEKGALSGGALARCRHAKGARSATGVS